MNGRLDVFEKKVQKTIERYEMLYPGDRVLVAVSGGPDSVALLRALHALSERNGIELAIFHLDHMLRGEESARDAHFVRLLADRMRLKSFMFGYDVKRFSKEKKLSLEEAGRMVRYHLLGRISKEEGYNRIAVGHQLDDRIETFFMRLIRGASLDGLASIPSVRKNIIRPLFEVTKSEIFSYLHRIKQEYRMDITNESGENLRSRIRNSLIPLILKENPRFREKLVENMEAIRDDVLFLNALSRAQFMKYAKKSEGLLKISLALKGRLPKAVLTRILKLAYVESGGDIRALTRDHVEALYKGMSTRTGFECDLPGKLLAVTEYGELLIGYAPRLLREELEPVVLGVKQEVSLGTTPYVIKAEEVKKSEIDFELNSNTCFIDSEKAGDSFIVRSWKRGDKMIPLGMTGMKKVHDIFIDEKIPRRIRKQIPVVVSKSGKIVWIAGLKVSEEFKVTDETTKVVKLELFEKRERNEQR